MATRILSCPHVYQTYLSSSQVHSSPVDLPLIFVVGGVSGEDLYINIYGAAADVNVRLDRNSVLMKRTYISMASQRCVTLANRSDVIVHYQWKCFGTEEEEEEQLKLRWGCSKPSLLVNVVSCTSSVYGERHLSANQMSMLLPHALHQGLAVRILWYVILQKQ